MPPTPSCIYLIDKPAAWMGPVLFPLALDPDDDREAAEEPGGGCRGREVPVPNLASSFLLRICLMLSVPI